MKLHKTVVERLIKIYQNYGGYREEHKLRTELQRIDLSTYDRQTGNQDTIIVLLEDLEEKQSAIL